MGTARAAAGFIRFALGALAEHVANQHMIGNVLIEVHGDEAFGEVYFNAYHSERNDWSRTRPTNDPIWKRRP